MKHARDDYNRIQDPAGKIPEDEPVFLLRAQDRYAWIVVDLYTSMIGAAGNEDMAEVCRRHVKAMREWKPQKDPDL